MILQFQQLPFVIRTYCLTLSIVTQPCCLIYSYRHRVSTNIILSQYPTSSFSCNQYFARPHQNGILHFSFFGSFLFVWELLFILYCDDLLLAARTIHHHSLAVTIQLLKSEHFNKKYTVSR